MMHHNPCDMHNDVQVTHPNIEAKKISCVQTKEEINIP